VFRCMFRLQPSQREVESHRCSDWGSGGLGMPTEVTEYFENRPDPLWGPPSLLFSGYVGCFPEVNSLGHEVDHLLASRLRTSGAIPLLPLYSFMVWTGTTSPSTFSSVQPPPPPPPTSVIAIPCAD
jgi:hypothetical protein